MDTRRIPPSPVESPGCLASPLRSRILPVGPGTPEPALRSRTHSGRPRDPEPGPARRLTLDAPPTEPPADRDGRRDTEGADGSRALFRPVPRYVRGRGARESLEATREATQEVQHKAEKAHRDPSVARSSAGPGRSSQPLADTRCAGHIPRAEPHGRAAEARSFAAEARRGRAMCQGDTARDARA